MSAGIWVVAILAIPAMMFLAILAIGAAVVIEIDGLKRSVRGVEEGLLLSMQREAANRLRNDDGTGQVLLDLIRATEVIDNPEYLVSSAETIERSMRRLGTEYQPIAEMLLNRRGARPSLTKHDRAEIAGRLGLGTSHGSETEPSLPVGHHPRSAGDTLIDILDRPHRLRAFMFVSIALVAVALVAGVIVVAFIGPDVVAAIIQPAGKE